MQGSNLFTGKLIETGEHVRVLIIPWLAIAVVLIGTYFWQRKAMTPWVWRSFSALLVLVCSMASLHFLSVYVFAFADIATKSASWHEEQSYAGPFAWIDRTEKKPVVIGQILPAAFHSIFLFLLSIFLCIHLQLNKP
jgi:small-conductance mechanosensitive channel